jgi:hypothetical protein
MAIKDELKLLVESGKVRLESVMQQIAERQAEAEMLSNDLAAYQRTIEALSRNDGDGAPGPTATPASPGDGGLTVVASGPPAATAPTLNSSGTEPNIAKLIRQVVFDNRVAGCSASKIREAVAQKGVKCSSGYLYSSLSKMKKRGAILKKDDKFFPSEKLLKPEARKETAS